ncbi:MAG: HAD family hydrolase [Armatimonadota bacterium]
MSLSRESAWNLLCEYVQSENLRKHMLAVEACMRYYARLWGEDENLWGIVGLLHDIDYEQHPSLQEHPFVGMEILRQKGYPEEVVRAVGSHVDHTGIPRQTRMEHTLYACDELTGFVVAVALVRPNKKLAEVDVASVRKKMKDKAFARAVNREELLKGAEALGVPFDEHVQNVIRAMSAIADELGL